jgi:hypothetical protein
VIELRAKRYPKMFIPKGPAVRADSIWPGGWYIVRSTFQQELADGLATNPFTRIGLYGSIDGARPLCFASQKDCEVAIAAFHKSGITKSESEWIRTPVLDKRRIACEALPW